MRIGFFGGSFDPPHAGHLAVAQSALREFVLGSVQLAPVASQPLKNNGAFASYAQRSEMVEALCQGVVGLTVSRLDAPRDDGGPNYTIDTLRSLQTTYPAATLFSIAGLDSFTTLPHWREPEELLKIAEWIVVSRPGSSFAELDRLGLSPAQRARVHMLPNLSIPVSATEIRRRLATGDPCAGIVPEPVLAVIREHHLYGA